MRKLSTSVLFLIAVGFASAVCAQTAKFGNISYDAPVGWKVEDQKTARVLRIADAAKKISGLIAINEMVAGSGDPAADFADDWKNRIAESVGNVAMPEAKTAEHIDGWSITIGAQKVETSEGTLAVVLAVYTKEKQRVCVVTASNAAEYIEAMEPFLLSLRFDESQGKAASVSEPINSKLIGKWQRSGSSHPTYADPVSWGTAGYTTSRYEFKPDGTYIFTERSFRMSLSNIIVVKENGTYTASGSTLTIKPAKSTIAAYKKAGGVDTLGALVSSQNRALETIFYKFTFHYFEGIKEWNLVLQADAPTQRDGQFSNNTTFRNAWYFDQKFTDGDLSAAKAK